MILCCEFFLLASVAGVVPTRIDPGVCLERHLVRPPGLAKNITVLLIVEETLAYFIIFQCSNAAFLALFELFLTSSVPRFVMDLWCYPYALPLRDTAR